MQQLDIFTHTCDEPLPSAKKRVGRPNKITPKLVFDVIDDINKNIKNKKIIQKHGITERTFFRIKKGEYDHLLEQALETEVEEFSLCLSD